MRLARVPSDVPRALAGLSSAQTARWQHNVDVDYEKRLLREEREIELQLRDVVTWSDEYWALVRKLGKTRDEVLRVRARLAGKG